jgi:uncharacterized membrane protein YccF (DUF307 family)
MHTLRQIGNLLWFLLGGFWMGVAVTVVGWPWARASFVISRFAFWPFGKEAISRAELTGVEDLGTGPLGTVGNLIWFVCAGIWLAIGHLLSALACAVTIIGIPFAVQHLKIAVLTLSPIGKTIVRSEEAEAARLYAAQAAVARSRGG